MTERRQEFVLCLIRLLCCDSSSFRAARTDILGYIARNFREPAKITSLISHGSQEHFRRKRRSIFANAQPLFAEVRSLLRLFQIPLRLSCSGIFCRIKTGKVFSDDFPGTVALDPLRA